MQMQRNFSDSQSPPNEICCSCTRCFSRPILFLCLIRLELVVSTNCMHTHTHTKCVDDYLFLVSFVMSVLVQDVFESFVYAIYTLSHSFAYITADTHTDTHTHGRIQKTHKTLVVAVCIGSLSIRLVVQMNNFSRTQPHFFNLVHLLYRSVAIICIAYTAERRKKSTRTKYTQFFLLFSGEVCDKYF